MITVSARRGRSFDGYLQLFHWTELIQSSPLAVERAAYEVIGGAYRKNHVTTMELRFNPMKRNRGGEQDLDHIISAAIRGMDRAMLEYPVKPGLILCLDRAFPVHLNEIIAEKAIAYRGRGVVGVDIAGPESDAFHPADYRALFRRCRKKDLGITVHTGESGPVEEIAGGHRGARAGPHRARRQGGLRPAHHGPHPRARHHPGDLPHQQPQLARGLRLGRVQVDLRHLPAATACATPSTPTVRRCSRPTSATSWPRWRATTSSRWKSRSRLPRGRGRPHSCRASRRDAEVPAPRRTPATRRQVEREEA